MPLGLPRGLFTKIINCFLIAVVILLISYVGLIINYGLENSNLKPILDYPFRNIIEGKMYLNITPTYLSLWFSFAIFCLLYKIKISNKRNIIFKLLIILFYVFVFVSSARMVFLTLSFILIIYGFVINKIKFRYKLIGLFMIGSIFIVVGLNVSKSSSFVERYYNEIFIRKIKKPKGRKPTSLSIRYGVYSCGLKLVKESPIIGYGVGDVQNELDSCYEISFVSSVFKKSKFDSHNYYLFLL